MLINKNYSLMIITALLWSGAFITGKWALLEFSPGMLTFVRFIFALPFIFAILWLREPQKMLPTKEQWIPLIILGIMGTFNYHFMFFYSLKYTTAINASLIGAAQPAITAVLAIFILQERLRFLQWIGIALAFVGILLIVTNGQLTMLSQLQLNRGDLFMLVGITSMAIYSILGRIYMKRYNMSPLFTTAYIFLVCVGVSAPFFVTGVVQGELSTVTIQGVMSALYMAFFSSVLGYWFHLIAVQNIGPSKAAVFINLVPVFTIILAVTFLGESFTLFKLALAGTIILGVFLAMQGKSK